MRGFRTSQVLAGTIGLIVILGATSYCVWFRAESNRLNVIIVTLDTTRASVARALRPMALTLEARSVWDEIEYA